MGGVTFHAERGLQSGKFAFACLLWVCCDLCCSAPGLQGNLPDCCNNSSIVLLCIRNREKCSNSTIAVHCGRNFISAGTFKVVATWAESLFISVLTVTLATVASGVNL
ncbi:hypothetical protein CEXT_482031 [Caerostris extrusa]|uniref:Uncharacterized protein n=1 Tax=Caerostris extrusa TaxID=172846 RepID=A0AAV4NZ64_CAEEX|nr:hypothetical protein CEXT_482031 [Caerostris extrusa]